MLFLPHPQNKDEQGKTELGKRNPFGDTLISCPFQPLSVAGINVMKRKLGAHDNLKLTITQDGNKFTVKESSNFRNIDVVFELGVNFPYSLADGTELTVRHSFKI